VDETYIVTNVWQSTKQVLRRQSQWETLGSTPVYHGSNRASIRNPVGFSKNTPKIVSMPIRLICVSFGSMLLLGGLITGSYIPTDFDDYTPVGAAIEIAFPAILMLLAFYLAFRMLKFAALARK
jgi:hypothetical protein